MAAAARVLPKVARTLPDSTSSMSETRAGNRWLIESYHKRVATRYPAPAGEQLGIIEIDGDWGISRRRRPRHRHGRCVGGGRECSRRPGNWSPDRPLAGFVSSRYDRIAGRLGLLPQRWAILRSFTVEPLCPLLKAGAYAAGIALETHVGEFNAYAQEILDPESALYRFQPDAVVLAVQTRDVAPGLWRGEAAAETTCSAGSGTGSRSFRKHSKAALIVHSLEAPAVRGRRHTGRAAGGQCGRGDSAHQSWIARDCRGVSRGLYSGLRRAGGAARARELGRCAQVANGPAAGSLGQPAAPRLPSGCASCIPWPARWPSAWR